MYGLCWIIGNGELDILPGLVYIMLITKTIKRGTQRTQLNGSRISWLLLKTACTEVEETGFQSQKQISCKAKCQCMWMLKFVYKNLLM